MSRPLVAACPPSLVSCLVFDVSLCLCLYLSLGLCLSLFLSLCLCLFLCLSLSVSVSLSVCLSLCLSLSLYLYLYLSIYVYLEGPAGDLADVVVVELEVDQPPEALEGSVVDDPACIRMLIDR